MRRGSQVSFSAAACANRSPLSVRRGCLLRLVSAPDPRRQRAFQLKADIPWRDTAVQHGRADGFLSRMQVSHQGRVIRKLKMS